MMIGELINDARAKAMAYGATVVGIIAGLSDALLASPDGLAGGFGSLWATSGTLFSALSVSASTLGGSIAWIPEGALANLAVAVGIIYVMRLIAKMVAKARGD